MPFKIVRNDITKMKVDAVVNSANPNVAIGRGVDETIYRAAGWEELFEDRKRIGPMRRGSAAITPGHDLDAKYIIHTVGPRWDPEDPEPARRQLRSCYDNAMTLALEYGVGSIAFPLISTGNYSFPKEEGLNIAFSTISKYLYANEMDVYLVIYDEEAFSLSKKLLDDIDEFIDSRYVEEKKIAYGGFNADGMSGSGTVFAQRSAGMGVPEAARPMAENMRKASKRRFPSILQSGRKASRDERIYDEKPEEILMDAAAELAEAEEPAPAIQAESTQGFTKYDSLEDLLKHRGETFQERLFRFMDMSGKSDVEIYKGANLTKQTFSKIKKPGHIPKKRTILALAISMGLSIDDTKDLLESAGQAFSPSDKVDLAVQFCMDRGIYNILDVERILFEKFGETLVS